MLRLLYTLLTLGFIQASFIPTSFRFRASSKNIMVGPPKINHTFLCKSVDDTTEELATKVNRRNFIHTTFAILPALTWSSPADAVTFQDEECGFELQVPSNWNKSVQALEDRRKITIFLDPNNDSTLLFMAYTPVRDDFTSLSSFGTVDQVAQMTILPKSVIAGQTDVEGSMLLAESKKNAYYFDYTTKVPGQPLTHFRTIFALMQGATGGAGSILLTITAQTPEDKYLSMKPIFDDIISSYRRIT